MIKKEYGKIWDFKEVFDAKKQMTRGRRSKLDESEGICGFFDSLKKKIDCFIPIPNFPFPHLFQKFFPHDSQNLSQRILCKTANNSSFI